jgi:hypothetical protein
MPIERNNDEERADRIHRLVHEHPTNTARDGETSQEPAPTARPAEAWVRLSEPRPTKTRAISPPATGLNTTVPAVLQSALRRIENRPFFIGEDFPRRPSSIGARKRGLNKWRQFRPDDQRQRPNHSRQTIFGNRQGRRKRQRTRSLIAPTSATRNVADNTDTTWTTGYKQRATCDSVSRLAHESRYPTHLN